MGDEMEGALLKMLESSGASSGLIVAAFLVTNLFTFLTARGTSKDKNKTDLLATTITRQNTLDERQQKMMDDLQEEINRVKSDMMVIKSEADKQQKRNDVLSQKYSNLLENNHSLQTLVLQLRQEKNELSEQVKDLIEKNTGLVEQVRLLTEQMTNKKKGQS